MPSFYDFPIVDITRKPMNPDIYKGKVVLAVNVASQCGFTPQYEGLEALYQKFKDRGLVVIGFPCNQFGGQESAEEHEIAQFCKARFGVTFPLSEKVEVNGDKANPLWEWMKSQKSQLMMSRIKWNFEKFLIDKEGKVVDRFASTTTPQSLESAIEKLLK